MPDLKQRLLDHDLGHLRIIAEHWGVFLAASDSRTGITELVGLLLEPELITDILEALPENAILALKTLQSNQGKLTWSQFTRHYGEVREMGPGRLDRERPDRVPVSTTEILWYRALIGRAFFDTPRGTEEFAYIPSDLLTLLPKNIQTKSKPEGKPDIISQGRAATTPERAVPSFSTDRIIDHACTLLAGQRMGLDADYLNDHVAPFPLGFIRSIINLAGLSGPDGIPVLEDARSFLESSRSEALSNLAQAWLNSTEHNDLHHVPNLQPEGEWTNDPLGTRRFILQLLSALPPKKWWNLSAFTADVRQQYPDFQRPAGDYDSWYLREISTGNFLRGFEHWNDVDGALIHYLITGPLHWLGMVDLAAPEEDTPVTAFRLSKWGIEILAGVKPSGMATENALVHVRSDGRVNVPVLTPRAVRYQLARFCTWESGNQHEYRYRLTPSSLARARDVGLRVSHLLSLLRRQTETIPPNILTALDRWNEKGTQVRLQEAVILRLGSPQILETLRNSRASRFLEDPLGPTTIMVKPGAEKRVLAALTEMGYFGEIIKAIPDDGL